METSTSILEKFKQSIIFKVVSGYAIVAFVTVQIASLVSDSFGFGEEFMQNIIIVFLVVLPFIALIAWAASSRYGTFKILGISLVLLFTGYGTGSYIWVNNFMQPQINNYLNADDNISAWLASNQINSFAPFFSSIEKDTDDISVESNIQVMQDGANIYWKAYENDQEWRFLGKTPLSPVRLPKGILQIKIEKEGYETALLSISNPSMRLDNFPIYVPWKLDPINLQPLGSVPNGMV